MKCLENEEPSGTKQLEMPGESRTPPKKKTFQKVERVQHNVQYTHADGERRTILFFFSFPLSPPLFRTLLAKPSIMRGGGEKKEREKNLMGGGSGEEEKMVVREEDTGEKNGRSTEIPSHYYFSSFGIKKQG